jgi:hypothetical protein
MRRTALAEVEGYDPGLIAGEEPALCRRLRARGYSIVHIDAPMTRHDLNMTRFANIGDRPCVPAMPTLKSPTASVKVRTLCGCKAERMCLAEASGLHCSQ